MPRMQPFSTACIQVHPCHGVLSMTACSLLIREAKGLVELRRELLHELMRAVSVSGTSRW